MLPERLKLETAAEAASWMMLWWRSLWISAGYANRFVLHHLYTRALGLRLILAGEASGPFCDWEILLARGAARFAEDGRLSAKLRFLLMGESDATLDSSQRGRLAPGHLSAATRLMAGLEREVEAFK
jgi:hypothetical protein